MKASPSASAKPGVIHLADRYDPDYGQVCARCGLELAEPHCPSGGWPAGAVIRITRGQFSCFTAVLKPPLRRSAEDQDCAGVSA